MTYQNKTIHIENIFRENEIDKGFVLRANDEVGRLIREMLYS